MSMDEDAYIQFVEHNYEELRDDFVLKESDLFDKFCLRMWCDAEADRGDALRDAVRESDVDG